MSTDSPDNNAEDLFDTMTSEGGWVADGDGWISRSYGGGGKVWIHRSGAYMWSTAGSVWSFLGTVLLMAVLYLAYIAFIA